MLEVTAEKPQRRSRKPTAVPQTRKTSGQKGKRRTEKMCLMPRLWELLLHSQHPELNHPRECRRDDSPPPASPSCQRSVPTGGIRREPRARPSGKHTVGRITQTAKLPSLCTCNQAKDASVEGDLHLINTGEILPWMYVYANGHWPLSVEART